MRRLLGIVAVALVLMPVSKARSDNSGYTLSVTSRCITRFMGGQSGAGHRTPRRVHGYSEYGTSSWLSLKSMVYALELGAWADQRH